MADYKQELSAKLEAARKRVKLGREVKQLKSSAPSLFEIMDTEISLAVNAMTAEKPLERDEYLQKHGEVRGIMKIRNLLNFKEAEEVQAAQEAEAIAEQVKQFDNDQKQK